MINFKSRINKFHLLLPFLGFLSQMINVRPFCM